MRYRQSPRIKHRIADRISEGAAAWNNEIFMPYGTTRYLRYKVNFFAFKGTQKQNLWEGTGMIWHVGGELQMKLTH